MPTAPAAERGIGAFWARPIEAWADGSGGLTAAEAEDRADALGTSLHVRRRTSGWRLVVRQVEDPLACLDEPCDLVLHDEEAAAAHVEMWVAPDGTIGEVVEGGWSELGISERAAAAVMHPELILFLSTDGATFEPIDVREIRARPGPGATVQPRSAS